MSDTGWTLLHIVAQGFHAVGETLVDFPHPCLVAADKTALGSRFRQLRRNSRNEFLAMQGAEPAEENIVFMLLIEKDF